MDQFDREAVSKALFQACKLVLWKFTSNPTLKEQVENMGTILRQEHITYQHRGCLAKFNSVWGGWLDFPAPIPVDLVMDRLC